jgi:hypothetical protein
MRRFLTGGFVTVVANLWAVVSASAQGAFGPGGSPFPDNLLWSFWIMLVVVGILLVAKTIQEALPSIGHTHRSASSVRPVDRNLRTARSYDTAKWEALVKYDDDVASAEAKIRPFGQTWVDELAHSYLVLGEKSYLQAIVSKIQERAAAATANEARERMDVEVPANSTAQQSTARPYVAGPQPIRRTPLRIHMETGVRQGLAIAALVSAILAIFVPAYGLWLSGLALVLATIVALAGERTFATVTPVVAFVNTYFMSPFVWMYWSQASQADRTNTIVIFGIFLLAPFCAMLLNHLAIGNDRAPTDRPTLT